MFGTPAFVQKGNKKPNRAFFRFRLRSLCVQLFGGYVIYRSKSICGVTHPNIRRGHFIKACSLWKETPNYAVHVLIAPPFVCRIRVAIITLCAGLPRPL